MYTEKVDYDNIDSSKYKVQSLPGVVLWLFAIDGDG